MGLFGNNQPAVQQSPRDMLEQKYNSSRANLLLVIVFTAINMILMVAGSDTYFLFSAFVPYMMVVVGALLGGKAPEEYYEAGLLNPGAGDPTIFYVLLVIAVIILALYLVCWLLSKKNHVGWLIFALVLFVIDTVAMLLFGEISEMIFDIVFHAWVLFGLIGGISAHFKLKKLPEEPEEPVGAGTDDEEPVEENGEETDSLPKRRADNTVKARILLEAEANGKKIVYRRVNHVNELVIDGDVYDEIEGIVEFEHTLRARLDGHVYEARFDGAAHSRIYVDGVEIAKKLRLV